MEKAVSDRAETKDAALAEILSDLPPWLDGVSQFIKVSKSHWPHATVRDDLLAAKLARDTGRIREKILAYAEPHGRKSG
ncbi:hypothetical protein [Sinorhizobium meliloti]|uniref:hypothetical protein n=1 Tax=Rhizobium meliloti TaxID=382 RepID=UPI00299E0E9F|nr:hypothetical protein [Sinorhizobium meliloti]